MRRGVADHFRAMPFDRRIWRTVGAAVVLASLSACASDGTRSATTISQNMTQVAPRPQPSRSPEQASPPTEPLSDQQGKISDLKGWATEDHLAAFAAFRTGCRVAKEADLRTACAAANASGVVDDEGARRFFERRFRVEILPGEGVLTGYFAPVYPARATRDAEYSAPVRPPPPLSRRSRPLTPVEPDPLSPTAVVVRSSPPVERSSAATQAASRPDPNDADRSSDPIGGLLDPPPPVANEALEPPNDEKTLGALPLHDAERAVIEQAPADDAIAWMRPEDLFFMQIQGSGVLVFPDGSRKRAAYAGDNGKPFVGIARIMARDGLLPANGVSGDAIRRWLSNHAGPEADQVMRKNPRYVFFRIGDDLGGEPLGAAGVPLPPGRAIAMDSAHHAFGVPYWIDAEAPVLAGASAGYHRLAVALDTGGAIRGPIRADLYFGTGDVAGREAGRVRHVLRLARLVPVDSENAESSDASTARPGRR